jgi:hypothetical protein
MFSASYALEEYDKLIKSAKNQFGQPLVKTRHPSFSADFELNAVLTIPPASVIKIPLVGCRSMIAVGYPALLHIGIHHVMAHNFKFSLIPLSKREFFLMEFRQYRYIHT